MMNIIFILFILTLLIIVSVVIKIKFKANAKVVLDSEITNKKFIAEPKIEETNNNFDIKKICEDTDYYSDPVNVISTYNGIESIESIESIEMPIVNYDSVYNRLKSNSVLIITDVDSSIINDELLPFKPRINGKWLLVGGLKLDGGCVVARWSNVDFDKLKSKDCKTSKYACVSIDGIRVKQALSNSSIEGANRALKRVEFLNELIDSEYANLCKHFVDESTSIYVGCDDPYEANNGRKKGVIDYTNKIKRTSSYYFGDNFDYENEVDNYDFDYDDTAEYEQQHDDLSSK